MGQDIGEFQEFSEQRAVNMELLQYPKHKGVHELMKDLNMLYRTNPALYELDNDPDGFQWMNCVSWQDCYVTFVRKGKKKENMLFIAANFSGVKRELTAAVPYDGKYKEIINTDAVKYGGTGLTNPRLKKAKKQAWDGQEYCININVAPQSVAIFEFVPYTKEELAAIKEAEAKKLAEAKKKAKEKEALKKAAAQEKAEKKEGKPGTYTKKAVPKAKKKA